MRGIPFKWGGTDPATGLDCFGLASHVSDRLFGLPFDLTLDAIARSYRQYPTVEAAPPDLLPRLADELGLQRVGSTKKGTLLLINSVTGLCLATCLSDGLVAFMGAQKSHVCPLSRFNGGDILGAYSPLKLIFSNPSAAKF